MTSLSVNDGVEGNTSHQTILTEVPENFECKINGCLKIGMDLNENFESCRNIAKITMFLEVLEKHDFENAKMVCKFLSESAKSEKLAKYFIEKDGISIMLKLFDTFDDDAINENIIEIFNAIIKHDKSLYQILIPAFVDILETSTNTKLSLKIAKFLNYFATKNKEIRKLLLTRKSIPIFISLLNPSNITLAKYGCRALLWYSTDIDDIVSEGAIPKFIKLLNVCNFGLIELSLINLKKICENSAFGEEDAVEMGIISYLSNFLSCFNEECSEIAAKIICHISEGVKRSKDAIVDDPNVIPNLLSFINNSSNVTLCQIALETFKNLFNGTQKHREALVKAGVFKSVLEFLSTVKESKKKNYLKIVECIFNFLENAITKDVEIFIKEMDFAQLQKNFIISLENENLKKMEIFYDRIYAAINEHVVQKEEMVICQDGQTC